MVRFLNIMSYIHLILSGGRWGKNFNLSSINFSKTWNYNDFYHDNLIFEFLFLKYFMKKKCLYFSP